MHRIFVNPQHITPEKITLQGESLIKVKRVLRLKPDDTLWIFDGTGHEYLSRIVSLTPSEGELNIVKNTNPVRESPLEIHLGQALPKANKMDLIVQKAVELGVTEIHPFYSARTIPSYQRDQVERRVRRWQKIAQEASQQSGRTRIPKVHAPVEFSHLLNSLPKNSTNIILQREDAKETLKNVLHGEKKAMCIAFLVGPEGGFTPEEITHSINYGFKPVSLGERILRTETVAITFLSIIQYAWGDIY